MLFCKLIMRTFRPTKRLSTMDSQPYLTHNIGYDSTASLGIEMALGSKD